MSTPLVGTAVAERWAFEMVSDLPVEVRYALRSLARAPVWSFSLILTIALGIGSIASVGAERLSTGDQEIRRQTSSQMAVDKKSILLIS